MKGKVAFILGAAVGYVLGARAGRARYEQIKRTASGVWESPTVQRGVSAVSDVVNDRVDAAKTSLVEAGKRAISGALNRDAASTGTAPAQPAAPEPAGTETPAAAEQPSGSTGTADRA